MPHALLRKLDLISFEALPFLNTGKRQTIAAAYLPDGPLVHNDVRHIVPLADGDKIVLIENRPTHWQPNGRIVLLVHGLTGSSSSKYLVRLAHKLTSAGFLVMRMNLRGCGIGHGLAKHLYHSGRSEDTRAVLHYLAKQFPHSKVTQAGFSLGANITLKMAGEDSHTPSGNLDSIIAVSPPLDLESSVKLIIHKHNQLFNDFFVKGLLEDIKALHDTFPELEKPHFPKKLNVYEFDDIYTAPRSGFLDAKDYYTKSSSKQFIEGITLPTLLMYAKDDPVISRRSFLKLPHKKDFDVLITSRGGHVGWLGHTGRFANWRWMDKAVVNWINWFDTNNKER